MSQPYNHDEKFVQFDKQVEENNWPADTCPNCVNGACCKRHSHHLYDVCLHCGNDERNIRKMKFRGR